MTAPSFYKEGVFHDDGTRLGQLHLRHDAVINEAIRACDALSSRPQGSHKVVSHPKRSG
jgi:hypothetical protein